MGIKPRLAAHKTNPSSVVLSLRLPQSSIRLCKLEMEPLIQSPGDPNCCGAAECLRAGEDAWTKMQKLRFLELLLFPS